MILNASIPYWKCFVRNEFLYNLERGFGEFTKAEIAGVQARKGRALMFHARLENGAMFWGLPLHALCQNTSAKIWKIEDAYFWNALSYEISVNEFTLLKEAPVRVFLRSKTLMPGEYMFTVDFYNFLTPKSHSEEPSEHKCVHIIALENGNYIGAPNNRIQWLDSSFIEPFTTPPDYEINQHVWCCEKGISTGQYFYEILDDPHAPHDNGVQQPAEKADKPRST